jgi:hypothetical protein
MCQNMRRKFGLAQFFEAHFKLAIFATAKPINMLSDQAAQQHRIQRSSSDQAAKGPHRAA